MDDYRFITGDPLPPETTTPMPPMLHTVYDHALGWPGLPHLKPDRPPIVVKPHITVRNWPTFTKKMSATTDSVQT